MRTYAVAAGSKVTDSWLIADLEDWTYHLQIHGPNGFLREFQGDERRKRSGIMDITMEYARAQKESPTL